MNLPPTDFQLKVPFGILENGDYVTPKDVRRENKWKICCAECKRPISLKCEKSNSRQRHFAHHPNETTGEGKIICHGGPTALHQICIDRLVGKTLEVLLPDERTWVEKKIQEKGNGSINHLLDNFPNWSPETVEIRNGKKEVTLKKGGNTTIADLIVGVDQGEIDQGRLAIEIHVHHEKSIEDIEKYRALNIPCIEIHMKPLLEELKLGVNFDRVEEQLLRGTQNRNWIFSPNENLILQADQSFHKKMTGIQSTRKEEFDWAQTLVDSTPEGCKAEIFKDESQREIVVIQSFSETKVYEPPDGRPRIIGSLPYHKGPRSEERREWSPIFKEELKSAVATPELEWLMPLVDNLEEDKPQGLVGTSITNLLPLGQKKILRPISTILDKTGAVPHQTGIESYSHPWECPANMYRAASIGIGVVNARTDTILPAELKQELEFLKETNAPCTCPKWNKYCAPGATLQWDIDPAGRRPKIEQELLKLLPDWIKTYVRRIEHFQKTIEVDFYLDITRVDLGPHPELKNGQWPEYFAILFDEPLKTRFLKQSGRNNQNYSSSWFEENLEACKKLEREWKYPQENPTDKLTKEKIAAKLEPMVLPTGDVKSVEFVYTVDTEKECVETTLVVKDKTGKTIFQVKCEELPDNWTTEFAINSREEKISPIRFDGVDKTHPIIKKLEEELNRRGITTESSDNSGVIPKIIRIILKESDFPAMIKVSIENDSNLGPWWKKTIPPKAKREKKETTKSREREDTREGWTIDAWKENGIGENSVLILIPEGRIPDEFIISIQEAIGPLVKSITVKRP